MEDSETYEKRCENQTNVEKGEVKWGFYDEHKKQPYLGWIFTWN